VISSPKDRRDQQGGETSALPRGGAHGPHGLPAPPLHPRRFPAVARDGAANHLVRISRSFSCFLPALKRTLRSRVSIRPRGLDWFPLVPTAFGSREPGARECRLGRTIIVRLLHAARDRDPRVRYPASHAGRQAT
jgi:hypothetical protein